MTEHDAQPTESVEVFLDAFAATDFDTALTFLSDDVEYTNIPLGMRDGIITVWRDYFDLATAAKIHDAGAA